MAYAVSRIAHWEWSENWPELFNILQNCLTGEDEFAVHGAIRVLTEFTRDLTDAHLPRVGPLILAEMYRIIQSDAVSTYTSLMYTLAVYFLVQYIKKIIRNT